MTTITVNVGGTKFETLKSTLLKSEYFSKCFHFNNNETSIFIDCDPEGFKHILEYLRFANYKIPTKFKYMSSYFMIEESAYETDSGYESDTENASDFNEIIKGETIGDCISTIEKILSSDLHDLTKSNKIFNILQRLICNGEVSNLFRNKKFVTDTIIIQKNIDNNLELKYWDESKDQVITICPAYYSKMGILRNDGYETTLEGLDPVLFIKYNEIDTYKVSNLYNKCKQINLNELLKNYIVEFIKLFKTNNNWTAIRKFKFLY